MDELNGYGDLDMVIMLMVPLCSLLPSANGLGVGT